MNMVMQMGSQIVNSANSVHKEDARSLSALEQYERRRQVVRAHQRGAKKVQIARELGLSYTAVCLIITRYLNQGADAILPHKRGRRTGEGRALSSEQEQEIQEMIRDKKPRQLQLDFSDWNRPAVAELIKKHLGVRMHIRSVTNYLKRWNIVVERAEPRSQQHRIEAQVSETISSSQPTPPSLNVE
ncbi:helix-turn-helix domain-containing protein [Undibacterium sp. Di27W]|uniref:helix-turn-helix domain-containing protein n=1 Tax=Undibacterium sp. Di27W TaxID=3413036 RepID=UPI003BEFADC3